MRVIRKNLERTLVIGDVHSSPDHLNRVLDQAQTLNIDHFIFLGDLTDRGPEPNEVIEIVHSLVKDDRATCLMGNHDWKLFRYYSPGYNVQLGQESQETVERLRNENVGKFLEIFDDEIVGVFDPVMKIFCSHAAGYEPYRFFKMLAEEIKRESGIDFCPDDMMNKTQLTISRKKASSFIYGRTSHDKNEQGLPIRLPLTRSPTDTLMNWYVIHGHIHAGELFPENNRHVICLDFCCGEEHGYLAGLYIPEKFHAADLHVIYSKGAV